MKNKFNYTIFIVFTIFLILFKLTVSLPSLSIDCIPFTAIFTKT